jgi:hypothetical protein
MTLVTLLLHRTVSHQWRSDHFGARPEKLGRYARLGIAFVVIWLVVNRPFWRYLILALSAMMFATMVLPVEMMFFVRHPALVFAILFTAGFVGANLGRSGIGSLLAWIVIAVLAVAIYRTVDADPATSSWLQ